MFRRCVITSTVSSSSKMAWQCNEARVFLNFSINGMRQIIIIPPCEKILVKEKDPVPVFLLGDPAYPPLPYLTK